MLVQRFGQLDASHEARIDAADMAELRRLIQRVVLGEQLADVFDPH